MNNWAIFLFGFFGGIGVASLFVWAFLTDLLDRLQFGNNPSNYFYMLYLRQERLKKSGVRGWLRKVVGKKDPPKPDREKTEEQLRADIQKDIETQAALDDEEEKHRKAREQQIREFLRGGKEAPL